MATDYFPYVGDIGTVIEINMGEILTSWVEADFSFKVKKPDDKMVVWSAVTVKGGGGEGDKTLKYTVVATDFSLAGFYFLTPYGNNNTGWKGHGRTIKFKVYAIYDGV